MDFPKSLTIGICALVLILALGLLLFVYFQGGIDRSIYLGGLYGVSREDTTGI